jgi:hypothetical protein
MSKKNRDTVTFTIHKTLKATLTGDEKAVQEILAAFVRGAAEIHVDQQNLLGRSREEVVAEMCKRIHIARRHQELGETDGFSCDLSDA